MIKDIGPHRLRHGDIMDGIDDLMGTERAAIMYCDPPWGEGLLKFFATLNRKQTGEYKEPPTLEKFLLALFGIASKYVEKFLLIEYGVMWRDRIQAQGIAAGFYPHGIVDLRYSGGHLDLHLFARKGVEYPPGFAEAVQGSAGYDTLRRAIPPLAAIVGPGAIILDPCCGMGYTARAALDSGLAFRGNELNRARLQKTNARLA